ncbi:MAG: SapC family protein [Alphaproteobacteria bacterium]|nr:SapC family protein [Alphaproteobacteria bacterium]
MAKSNEQKAATSPQLPLFYQSPAPLDSKAHRDLGLKKNFGLSFTRQVNAVPVNLIEMPQICHVYPIAFSPDDNATPVAILGLRDNENLFLDSKGEWLEDTYIPAYIRRYPFIFSEMPGSDNLSLCIDMVDTVTEKGGEQKFFDAEGKPTQLAQNALEFCKSYHAAAQHTIAFSRALAASGLLVERQAEINVAKGKKINFSGFRIIDEQKLSALDDATFADWRKKGWIPFLYAHLFSGAQWQRLTRLLNGRM